MAATNFTDNTTVVAAAWLNDADQVVYEQHGVGKTTVASATTPDIFAATVGNFIDYTGTTTCTGFAAAVSAGSHRTLYCAGAAVFTADANLLIEGISSGTTITLAAGAIVRVYAITTTQFKMTYSLSGTFTITGTGFAANPTGTARYKVENGWADLYIPALTGTSNATTFTLTGLPASLSIATSGVIFEQPFLSMDNSITSETAGTVDAATMQASLTVITLRHNYNTSGWTASGTKGIPNAACFRYKI